MPYVRVKEGRGWRCPGIATFGVGLDWNSLIQHINRALPGLGLWMQCVPVFDDDAPTEEGVGLAIQRASGPKGRRYTVVFFSVVPDPEG